MLVGRKLPYISATIFFSVAVVLCFIYSTDPAGLYRINEISVVKYFPIILVAVSLFFYVFSMYRVSLTFGHFVCFALFLYMVYGGVSYYFSGREVLADTFIGRALPIVSVLIGPYLAILYSKNIYLLMGQLSVAVSAVMFLLIFFWFFGFRPFDVPNIYHEEVFIFYMAVIYSYFEYSRRKFLLVASVSILGCLLTAKNTGFLVVGLTFSHIFFLHMKNSRYEFSRYFLVFSLTFFVGVLLFLSHEYIISLLPSGSPDVRLKTYEMRYEQFLDDPFLGGGFFGSPLIELPTISGPIYIPSHSDFLDILGFGGVVSVACLTFPVLYLFCKLLFGMNGHGHIQLFAAAVFGIFVTLLFNPILNQPHLSILYWFSLGMALALVKLTNQIQGYNHDII